MSKSERERERLLTDKGDGDEDGEGDKVPEDTEDELVDSGVKGHLSDDVVTSIEELHHSHGRVRPTGVATANSRHQAHDHFRSL